MEKKWSEDEISEKGEQHYGRHRDGMRFAAEGTPRLRGGGRPRCAPVICGRAEWRTDGEIAGASTAAVKYHSEQEVRQKAAAMKGNEDRTGRPETVEGESLTVIRLFYAAMGHTQVTARCPRCSIPCLIWLNSLERRTFTMTTNECKAYQMMLACLPYPSEYYEMTGCHDTHWALRLNG
ncbi:hypothetical protein AVEN_219559-1 [Araneus ventricosus]|uniref:Uncharacterized protein n=1 Tax=Araneus ventricosus TaxID=182803 RepID=A0A4Y2DCT0_ARAVE|nr:hypothetical protein AVEN_219559-1 [Araneus ventricosus]